MEFLNNRFLKKYWFVVAIVMCIAGFFTPGLTLISFMLFIFLSGFAVRPIFDGFFNKSLDFDSALIPPNKRKKTKAVGGNYDN